MPETAAYSGVLERLRVMADGMRVCALYQEFFGENVWKKARRSLFDVEVAFAGRVNAELFPIDLMAMDEMYYGSDEPIWELPIPVVGYRIPWEIAAGEELPGYMALVGDCIASLRTGGEDAEMEQWGDTERDAPYVQWLSGQGTEAALAHLSNLAPPLNGLADLCRLAMQEPHTGNPFLDFPPDHGWAAMEYAYDTWYWTSDDVHELAEYFDRVRDVAGRIHAFEAWFYDEADHDQDTANERILELLLRAGGQPPDEAAFEQWVERRDLDAYHRSDEYADYDDE
jgi:hypothetical protein